MALENELEIKGFLPLSTADWEGKLSAVLFVGGCNLRCPYCQNPDLVLKPGEIPTFSQAKILSELERRKKWLEGVVIGGGEPTIQPELEAFLRKVKTLDYLIKIDTNGTKPQVLRDLVQKKLIDAVAVDIKTSFSKYSDLFQRKVNLENLKEIFKLAANGLDYEFRTTVVPGYVTKEDVLEVAKLLRDLGAKNYVLQQFDPKVTLDPGASRIKPYSEDFLESLRLECQKFLPTRLRPEPSGSGLRQTS